MQRDFELRIRHFIRDVIISDHVSIDLKKNGLELYTIMFTGPCGDIIQLHNGQYINKMQQGEIQKFLSLGKKIMAIKLLRTITECNLKDAKDNVEDTSVFAQYVKE